MVAAGKGVRFGQDKMMVPVAGVPVVAHAANAVSRHVDKCVVVCRPDQIPALTDLDLGATLVVGGKTRTDSEMAGLDAIEEPARLIGIHDGARPLVPPALIEDLFEAAARVGGAIPVVDPPGPLVGRSDLRLVEGAVVAQTPQVFQGEALLAAYATAREARFVGADTAEVVRRFGSLEIAAVRGDPANIKVTDRGDLERVMAVLDPSRNEPR